MNFLLTTKQLRIIHIWTKLIASESINKQSAAYNIKIVSALKNTIKGGPYKKGNNYIFCDTSLI